MRVLTLTSLISFTLLLSGCLIDSANTNDTSNTNNTSDTSNTSDSDDASESDDSTSSAIGTADCEDDVICLAWLDEHNDLRALMSSGTVTDDGTDGNYPLPTTALPELAWNTALAEVAQAHAQECVFEHNANRQSEYVAAGGENIYIGENVAVHYTSSTSGTLASYATQQVNLWWDEHADWHYQAYQSSTINGAGHFTQMIWENTIEIGCGIAQCPNMDGVLTGYLGVCNYSPGGNYLNQLPYDTN